MPLAAGHQVEIIGEGDVTGATTTSTSIGRSTSTTVATDGSIIPSIARAYGITTPMSRTDLVAIPIVAPKIATTSAAAVATRCSGPVAAAKPVSAIVAAIAPAPVAVVRNGLELAQAEDNARVQNLAEADNVPAQGKGRAEGIVPARDSGPVAVAAVAVMPSRAPEE